MATARAAAERKPVAPERVPTAADCARAITRYEAERERSASAVEEVKATLAAREGDRQRLIERQVDGDATADLVLQDNAREIAAADRTLKDAETRLRIIDRKLTELRADHARLSRVEQVQAVRQAEAETRAMETDISADLTAVAARLQRLLDLKLRDYSLRHDIGEPVGRTPKRDVADLILRHLAGVAPQYFDRPFRSPFGDSALVDTQEA